MILQCGIENMTSNATKIPIKDGLFSNPSTPDQKPQLIGSKCPFCGELFFPKRMVCQNCQGSKLEETMLTRKGKIYSFTIVMQPPGSHYKGPVPYAFGWVELPEGVRIETLYTGCDFQELHIGMKVELVIEKLYTNDEGNEIVCHKFRPVKE
jgi:uncharacterized protein